MNRRGGILAVLMALLISGCASRPGVQKAGTVAISSEAVPTEVQTDSSVCEERRTFSIGNVSFDMIYVEPGTFQMGSDNEDVLFSESPAHEVRLTSGYWIGETEVTRDLWNAVYRTGQNGQTPQTSITWQDACDFCEALTDLARENSLISENEMFSLPTEAQWEYAARGGSRSAGTLYAGSNEIDEVAVTLENSGTSSPVEVKTKSPNELGLYDMSGNAYEWVLDSAGFWSGQAQSDPCFLSENESRHVKRGGSNYHSFGQESFLFTVSGRYFYGSTDWTIGMRLALVEKAE